MSVPTTEQTQNCENLLKLLQQQVSIAVDNNLAHASVSTNNWRDAITMIQSNAKSLQLFVEQLQGYSSTDAGGILKRTNASSIVQSAITSIGSMKLIFDTPARQLLLKKANTALKECQEVINKTASSSNSSSSSSSSYSSSTNSSGNMSAADLLKQPMPKVEKASVQFDPNNMRTGLTAVGGPDGNSYMGQNVKPKNFMTFSSAESSASARLGVSGKCSTCSGPREAGQPFCPHCGKNTNIIF